MTVTVYVAVVFPMHRTDGEDRPRDITAHSHLMDAVHHVEESVNREHDDHESTIWQKAGVNELKYGLVYHDNPLTIFPDATVVKQEVSEA